MKGGRNRTCCAGNDDLDVTAIGGIMGGMDGSSKTNVRPRRCIRSNCEMARLFTVKDKESSTWTAVPLTTACKKVE